MPEATDSYILRSVEGRAPVTIPKEISIKAGYISRCAHYHVDGLYVYGCGDLCNEPGYEYLKRPGIFRIAKALSETDLESPDGRRLFDLMFLKVCICENEKEHSKAALERHRRLESIVRRLESRT
jgi:hypothetical protein